MQAQTQGAAERGLLAPALRLVALECCGCREGTGRDSCLRTQMREALWADLQLQGTSSSICMASTSVGEAQRQAPRLLRQARLLT